MYEDFDDDVFYFAVFNDEPFAICNDCNGVILRENIWVEDEEIRFWCPYCGESGVVVE